MLDEVKETSAASFILVKMLACSSSRVALVGVSLKHSSVCDPPPQPVIHARPLAHHPRLPNTGSVFIATCAIDRTYGEVCDGMPLHSRDL